MFKYGQKILKSSKTIQYWKKQFLSNAALAFEPAKVLSEYQEQINHLQEQNDEMKIHGIIKVQLQKNLLQKNAKKKSVRL